MEKNHVSCRNGSSREATQLYIIFLYFPAINKYLKW